MKHSQLFLVTLVVLYNTINFSHAKVTSYRLGELVSPSSVPLAAPTIAELPFPANVQRFHKQQWKDHSSLPLPAPAGSPTNLKLLRKTMIKKTAPRPPSRELAPPQDIAPTKSSYSSVPRGFGHPSLSPLLSSCCKLGMITKRATMGCQCVYPIRLDILLLNVSTNPNWNLFLSEFSSQLGLDNSQIKLMNFYVLDLSRVNISMDITPNKGIGFSGKDASAINISLTMHKVHLDSKWVGDYRLINLTWFQPPTLPQAPVTTPESLESPATYHSSNAAEPPIVTRKKKHSISVFIIIIAAAILAIVVISALILLCTVRRTESPCRKNVKPQNTGVAVRAVESYIGQPSSTRFLAYEELKEATNNFEAASILGEGGFGRVFKGVLSDGKAVAIKRLNDGGLQGDKEFSVEVEMLSRLHHRNLVKLVGYYRDSSQSLLCYELVPNGSLESWLHGPLGAKCSLDWEMRMKIALDAARGLAYLHEDSQPCVIHRDFKASNILLENNFHAKVSDFGLAKQAPEGRANYLSTRVMGTFGYVAPEYAMTGHLLVRSDVYSYGVVLLELLSGRKPVDMSQPCGQENLVTRAKVILKDKDRLEELADPKLGGKYVKEDFVRVCTIAAACVAAEAGQRPTMGEVVQSLKMVQQDCSNVAAATLDNLRNSSNAFDSDGISSIFSSGALSAAAAAFDNDRQPVFSEDLQQGR